MRGTQKRWRDLTSMQKRGITILGIIQVSLLGAALWDIRRRPAEQIRGSKWLWTMVAFINYVGPLAYFIIGRKRAE
ncbi:MAG TPA: PLD nuclease N-terminal domain-containing protein [Roseiflexaceae bacterium]|jgi:hypothetical protein|nr:PLD nuclease N-terminal domain-containing protein [Roseiflexaceae bacterium]